MSRTILAMTFLSTFNNSGKLVALVLNPSISAINLFFNWFLASTLSTNLNLATLSLASLASYFWRMASKAREVSLASNNPLVIASICFLIL